MFKKTCLIIAIAIFPFSQAIAANGDLCEGYGPQTPRDISQKQGDNDTVFPLAPKHTQMNLCNIHTHTNAEHKGPGFNVFVNDSDNGGYACNETSSLTKAELAPSEGAYKGVKPGDTVEVHWVHSSCDGLSPSKIFATRNWYACRVLRLNNWTKLYSSAMLTIAGHLECAPPMCES